MIKIWPGIGFGGSAPLTPAASVRNIAQILGADYMSDWIGDDAVFNGSDELTGWIDRKASLAFTLSGAGKWKKAPLLGGRRGIESKDAATKSLDSVAHGAPKTIIVVAEMPALPIATQQGLAHVDVSLVSGGPAAAMLMASATSVWFAAGGWTNSVAAVSGATKAWISTKNNVTTGVSLGAWTTAQFWTKPIYRMICASSIITPTQSIAIVSELSKFYRTSLA